MRKKMREERWQDVPPYRNNVRSKGKKEQEKDVANSNLPNGCTPWEVSQFLGGFGEVVGTYIARKRDKEENCFGFTTFKHASKAKEIEQRLNGIKMGNHKLKVNIALFAAENAVFWETNKPLC
ncbi:putative RNA recognition motif domain, nucleotide-binding alpha-beta plait domain superfamily [Helianthus anomalus]